MLCDRESGIDFSVEERCVEMHACDLEQPLEQHRSGDAGDIDPVTRKAPACTMHEIEPVDEDMGTEPVHGSSSFPKLSVKSAEPPFGGSLPARLAQGGCRCDE